MPPLPETPRFAFKELHTFRWLHSLKQRKDPSAEALYTTLDCTIMGMSQEDAETSNLIAWLEQRAEQDDTTCQVLLYMIYEEFSRRSSRPVLLSGRTSSHRLKPVTDTYASKAQTWLNRAADLGCAEAQFRLAEIERYQDKENKGFSWYEKAAEQEHMLAQQRLAEAYIYELGVPKTYYIEQLEKFKRNPVDPYNLDPFYHADHEFSAYRARKFVEWMKKSAQQGNIEAQYLLGKKYAQGYNEDTEAPSHETWQKAHDWLQKAALAGLPDAAHELAYLYNEEWGGQANPEQTVIWMKKAAHLGMTNAMYWLAEGYMHGKNNLPQDHNQAYQWLKTGADHHHYACAKAIIPCYQEGIGTQKDLEQATYWENRIALLDDNTSTCSSRDIGEINLFRSPTDMQWLTEEAENADPVAQRTLAGIYEYKKIEQAIALYERAAALGDMPAQLALYKIYTQNRSPDTTTCNPERAHHWLIQRARAGDRKAQTQLACDYFHEKNMKGLRNKAPYWFMQAADQGCRTAQYYLGAMHYYGEILAEDAEEARKYLQPSAEKGEASAQYLLAELYKGTFNEATKSFYWFEQAAEQNNAKAQLGLGFLYAEGLGTAQDFAQAHHWYTQAAKNGQGLAHRNLAYMFFNGQGVKKCAQTALSYLDAAEEMGSDITALREEILLSTQFPHTLIAHLENYVFATPLLWMKRLLANRRQLPTRGSTS
ncbi:tetratricopeptide repeat protein [Magnetococcus sp. PR-3]|uniref:tetratricopeptide repeat protein n=1 Tax=Magnetococcus sp. PR-3 TaxID=3120355 RepID=UPI002FCE1647